jgi:hypothetical protein
MKNVNEGFDTVYKMMTGEQPKFTNQAEWEKFDSEFVELLRKEDVPMTKAKLTKIENLNIFESDFDVIKNIPESWKILYAVLNKYYTINVAIATLQKAQS